MCQLTVWTENARKQTWRLVVPVQKRVNRLTLYTIIAPIRDTALSCTLKKLYPVLRFSWCLRICFRNITLIKIQFYCSCLFYVLRLISYFCFRLHSPAKSFVGISRLPYSWYMIRLILLDFITLLIFCEEYKLWYTSLGTYLPPTETSFLTFKYSPQNPFSNTLTLA
jgi:hypothetical protein